VMVVSDTVVDDAIYFLCAGGSASKFEEARSITILAVAFAAIALYAPVIVGLLRHILGG